MSPRIVKAPYRKHICRALFKGSHLERAAIDVRIEVIPLGRLGHALGAGGTLPQCLGLVRADEVVRGEDVLAEEQR